MALGERQNVADPNLVTKRRARRQHFGAADRHARIVFRDDAERGHLGRVALIHLLVARTLRRGDRMRQEDVTAPAIIVEIGDMGGEFVLAGVEDVRLHRRTGNVAADKIRRPPHHAVGQFCDDLTGLSTFLKVGARTRLQEIGSIALTAFLVAQDIPIGLLEPGVVNAGIGTCGIAKSRMGGHVIDPLAAYINDASVSQPLKVVISALQHCFGSPNKLFSQCRRHVGSPHQVQGRYKPRTG